MALRPQAHDIIRTWAFYTIAKSYLNFGQIPWKEAVISGHVKKPGVYELPMGTPLREMIYTHAGGIRDGNKLKAVIPGGISAKILTADEIDIKMDYESLRNAGTMLGSAGVMVMDETTCMVKALLTACKFFAHESCGQCSPCREGTGWAYKIIQRIYNGEGTVKDLDTLLYLAGNMEGRTICVFADAATWPIQSYITKFRKEFEEYILNKKPDTSNQLPGKGSPSATFI